MEYDDTEYPDLTNALLYADSSRGVYIPQFFAESVQRECVSGVSEWHWMALMLGPYCDDEIGNTYWDAWDDVEQSAIVTGPSTGTRYSLYQDGDLWLVPCDV